MSVSSGLWPSRRELRVVALAGTGSLASNVILNLRGEPDPTGALMLGSSNLGEPPGAPLQIALGTPRSGGKDLARQRDHPERPGLKSARSPMQPAVNCSACHDGQLDIETLSPTEDY